MFPVCVQVNEQRSQTSRPHPPHPRTGWNTGWDRAPGPRQLLFFHTVCRECLVNPGKALELENTRKIARQLADWLSVHSHAAWWCLREALLQRSSCLKPQQGALLKVRLTHSHSLVTHKNKHMQLWNQNRSEKLPKKTFTFPR